MKSEAPSTVEVLETDPVHHTEATFPARPGDLPPPDNSGAVLRWLWVALALALLIGAVVGIRIVVMRAATRGNSMKGPAVLPVVGLPAWKGDVHIYLDGLLGNVTPLNTITLRTRVDGELTSVAFKEGQLVHAGDILAQIDPAPYQASLQQAQGAQQRDEAQLENARTDLKRYMDAPQTITAQTLATQAAQVKQYEGVVNADAAQVANAQLQLGYCTIRAPIDGLIGLRLVDAFNIVHQSDSGGLAVITQVQPIAVTFSIKEDDIPRVNGKAGPGGLEVSAYNHDFTRLLASGHLDAMDNQVDPTTGKIKLKALFQNERLNLFPNEFVNIRMLVETRHDALLVPTNAIQHGPPGSFVWKVDAENKVHSQVVTTGPEENGNTSITAGLQSGDVVITDGVDKLVGDMEIKVSRPLTAQTRQSDLPTEVAATEPADSSSGADTRASSRHRRRHSNMQGNPTGTDESSSLAPDVPAPPDHPRKPDSQ